MKKQLLGLMMSLMPVAAHAKELPIFPHVEGAPYYYFLCNATGWNLNASTRLQCDDPQCISAFLDYDVKADWMVTGEDTCNLLKTDTLD